MQRGEVWWANYPPGQRHPVLLLSWDAHGDWRTQVTVAGITRTKRGIDTEVELSRRDGMPQASVVNLADLQTLSRSSLERHLTTLSPERMADIERSLHLALGIALPCSVA